MKPSSSDESLLAQLFDLPRIERLRHWQKACAENPALRSRLPEIARILESPDSVAPASAPAPLSPEHLARALESALEPADREIFGSRIGPYRLLQKIGEGGFGTVWMAEQLEPIRRRVALKIVKVGMDTDEVIARFEVERQALALMDHPNIARVYDAGATTNGRPYFAMELVRGVAITRYCDDNRLTAEARLLLFIAVCQAVQHAHQKGVIHRDLKPSNILVTLADSVAIPKVIDFGIAKATEKRLTEKTLVTHFHAFVGTPAYTSPEQMEMSALDVDTRSDIYSLGVLLYELLAGRPPFDPDALLKSGLDAMRRTIREVDPPRPSSRLGTLGEVDRTSVAHARGTDAAKLALALRGDLDWIVMRCLEKNRMRRYETASALAREVERHLAHEPVTARPPSALYRAQKFTRRHRVGVAAFVAISVSIVGGLIASWVLFVGERAARGRADTAEKQQSELRRQAEVARTAEVKRVARTALDLANRNLADGRVADGLAYLVYAARKDPDNRTLGPRIASVLTSCNFIIPRSVPVAFGSRVLALRFARDGRAYFVGTEDGTFRVIDAESGVVLRQFSCGHKVVPDGWEFAVSNDDVVGARSPDNTFVLYDIATGAPRFRPLQLAPDAGRSGSARGVGLSPHGRWIYTQAQKQFWLWDAATGALQVHRTFAEVVGGCDFGPADEVLALAVGNAVERWKLPEVQPVGPSIPFRAAFPASQLPGPEVRFSPDGRRLAVVSYASAEIFDSVSGELVRQLPPLSEGHSTAFSAFATNDRLLGRSQTKSGWWDLTDGRFFPLPVPNVSEVSLDAAGRRGVAFSRDGWLRVFDFAGHAVAEPSWLQPAAYSRAISPDGTRVLLGTSDGLLYHFAIGRGPARPLILSRPQLRWGPAFALFLSQAPARLLAMAEDQARVIQIDNGREVAGGFRFPERIWYSALCDPDAKLMAARLERGWESWELASGAVRRIVPLEDSSSASPGDDIAVAATNERLAVTNSTSARVWDLRTGARIGPPIRYPGGIERVSSNFSPDGRRFALTGNDGAALVFDISTGRNVLNLATARQIATFSARFSPDGRRILTNNHDGEFRLWHGDTGEPIGPAGRMTASVAHPAFSPNSRWAAVRNTTAAMLLDVETGTVVGQTIPVGSSRVRFSPDSTRLSTAGHVRQAQVWDVPSGEPVTEPLPHSPPGFAAEFSPDGQFLNIESRNFFHVWAVPPALPEGMPPPDWLLDLATLCASQAVNEAGQLVPALEIATRVDRLRRQIAGLPADAPLAEWGRWVLDERPDRPIAPGFTVVPAEADALVDVIRKK